MKPRDEMSGEREGGHRREGGVGARERRRRNRSRPRVWAEEMEGRPIRGREDLSAGDGCADSKG